MVFHIFGGSKPPTVGEPVDPQPFDFVNAAVALADWQILLPKNDPMLLVCWILSSSQDFQMAKPCQNASNPMFYRNSWV